MKRGIITAGALICLAVASAIFVSILLGAAAHRRDTARWQRTLQARWLAESALERAASRLADDPSYDGETWTIAAERLGGRHGAVVRIRTEREAADAELAVVVVEAQYPDRGRRQVRITKSLPIPAPQGKNSNAEE